MAQGSQALLSGWRKMTTVNTSAFLGNPDSIFLAIQPISNSPLIQCDRCSPDDCMKAHGRIRVIANQHGSDRKGINALNQYLFVTSLQHGSIPFLSVVINQFSPLSNKCFLQFKMLSLNKAISTNICNFVSTKSYQFCSWQQSVTRRLRLMQVYSSLKKLFFY